MPKLLLIQNILFDDNPLYNIFNKKYDVSQIFYT
jgi:hypothetical protein